MKRLIAMFLFLAFTLPAFAIVDDGEAMYLGGTAVGVKEGTTGKFDTTQSDNLIFEYKGGKLLIPYAKVSSFQYERKLARHLGIAPTIAVAMVKHLQRRHFFTIDYKDEKGVPQSAVFEISKDMPQTLEAVLRVRAPRNARPQAPCYYQGCPNYVPPCQANNTCSPRADSAPQPGQNQAAIGQQPATANANAKSQLDASASPSNSAVGAAAKQLKTNEATAGADSSTDKPAPATGATPPQTTQIPHDEFPEWARIDD